VTHINRFRSICYTEYSDNLFPVTFWRYWCRVVSLLLSDTRVTHMPRLRFIRFPGYSDPLYPATFWSTSVLCLLLSNNLDTCQQSSPYSLHRVLGSIVFTCLVEYSYLSYMRSCVNFSAILLINKNNLLRIRHKAYANHLCPVSYLLEY